MKEGRAEFVILVSLHSKEKLIIIKTDFMWLSTGPEFICCKRITALSAFSQTSNATTQRHSHIQQGIRYLGSSPSEYVS